MRDDMLFSNFSPILSLGYDPSTELQQKLQLYYALLTEWNEKINLTAISGWHDFLLLHVADSLLGAPYIPQNASVIDVGTGAGFPGVVLALFRPDITLTLLDSLQKRTLFLQQLTQQLGISAQIVHARAEDGGRNAALRERFSVATARAVAPLNVLSELLLPFVHIGGTMLCYKAKNTDAEVESATRAIQTLGGATPKLHHALLAQQYERIIVQVPKVAATPRNYPRKAGTPAKNPL